MAQKFLTSINLNKNELQNVVLLNLAVEPSNPKAGQKYYNSGDNKEYIYNGTEWITYEPTDTTILRLSNVVNNLTSSSTTTPLSAALGKALNDKIASANDNIDTINTTLAAEQKNIDTLQGYFTNGIANQAAKTTGSLTVKFAGQSDVVFNGSANKTIDISAANIVTALGDLPVNRAIADLNGNVIDETYVTRAGDEDVTGVHDFTNGLEIGSVPIFKSQDGVIYIEGDLAVKGGVTMYAETDVDIPSIIQSLPVSGAYASAEEASNGIASFDSKYFTVTNGFVSIIEDSTGLDESQLQNYLDENGYIDSDAIANTYINKNLIGAASGLATLDSSGKVPSSQLPSYVDDVLEYSSKSNFPTPGETGKIYVATDKSKAYRWSGTTYVEIAAATIHKHSETLSGDGSKTDFTVTHSLGTRDVIVNLYESAMPYQQVWADIKMTSASEVTVTFAEAPASGTNYRITIIA